MDEAAIHEGVRRMRFVNLLDRQERREITQEDAAEILGVNVRTFQRWVERYREEGEEGLADRRLGKPSPRRAPAEEIARMLGLFEDKYSDFTTQHFHQHLKKHHTYKLGYTVTKKGLQDAGLVRVAPKRSAHRKKRAPRPLPGMMLHQDGSRHAWLEGQAPLDLIVTLDDATSRILSAFLVDEEGTASTFRGLQEVAERHGLFCSLYTDRGSHYWYTPEAGGKVSKTQLTQVGRALAQLGIEHIAAYSPEARGRSERAFRTLQDRLPKELRLAGITTVDAANRWLAETGIGEHNAEFGRAAELAGSAFVIDAAGHWRAILCEQHERVVAKDNTVAWEGLHLQLPESLLRPHFVKAKVRVHAHWDGTLSVHLGPHRLGAYTAAGVASPASTAPSMPACSEPSRTSPRGARKCASLTAPARAGTRATRVGTKERAPQGARTKELQQKNKQKKDRALPRAA
jgi:transposase